jgi:hypothetical protein
MVVKIAACQHFDSDLKDKVSKFKQNKSYFSYIKFRQGGT